jgi:hypothetical protein
MEADGIIDVFPPAELAVEGVHRPGALGHLVEFSGAGPLRPLDRAVELGALRRQDEDPDPPLPAGFLELGEGSCTRPISTSSSCFSFSSISRIPSSPTWSIGEFGKLVKLQEAEAQFITDYEVCATRVADGDLWGPALACHERLFGRAPRLAVADAGFASERNERVATDRGVHRVVLPRRGRLPPVRRGHQRQRWFRRGLRWRTGCEGRISVVKRRHGLRRCRYRGVKGMERWVGLGVIANNLYVFARAGPRTR